MAGWVAASEGKQWAEGGSSRRGAWQRAETGNGQKMTGLTLSASGVVRQREEVGVGRKVMVG